MAGRIRSAIMLVQEAAAAREIQQGQANQRRSNSPQTLSGQLFCALAHV
jgi:hypothetical protein